METCAAICLEGFVPNTNSSSFVVYILAPEEGKCWMGARGVLREEIIKAPLHFHV